MPVERRANSSHGYLYRSAPDGSGRKQYLGSTSNAATRAIVRREQMLRQELAERYKQIEDEKERYRQLEPLLRQTTIAIRRLWYVCLRVGVFDTHREERDPMEASHLRLVDPERESAEDTIEHLQRLRRRYNAGDMTALTELREMLTRHPEIYRQIGSLVARSLESTLEIMAPTDALARESIRHSIQEQTHKLEAEGHGTALEQLMIDQLMASHVRVNLTRLGMDGCIAPKGRQGDVKFWARRHDAEQRRFQETLKILIELRRILSGVPPAPVEYGETTVSIGDE